MTDVSAPVPDRHCILVIGTCDTKSDELRFVRDCLDAAGGEALIMDVGVLGPPSFAPDISNREVAAAADSTLAEIAACGDENRAMAKMAEGAARLARRLNAAGRVQGVLILGGTMGTDLALDVAAALPLGVPKLVVSTIAFSHLIPPQRFAPDLMMILWAGGLYGLPNRPDDGLLPQACAAHRRRTLSSRRCWLEPKRDHHRGSAEARRLCHRLHWQMASR